MDWEHHLARLDRFRWVRNVNRKLRKTSPLNRSPFSLMHFFSKFRCKHSTPERDFAAKCSKKKQFMPSVCCCRCCGGRGVRGGGGGGSVFFSFLLFLIRPSDPARALFASRSAPPDGTPRVAGCAHSGIPAGPAPLCFF